MLLRKLLAGACAALIALAHGQAAAQAAVDVDLPAQPLGQALNALAQATGTPVAAPAALVAGRQAPALRGRFTAGEALSRLLAGSGLEAQREGAGFVVRRAGTTSQSDQQLPEVRVSAASENAWGPVEGYTPSRSATGTKTDTPLLETPRSISVIGAERIADQKAEDFGAALRYTPGVYAEHRGQDTTRPQLVVRGFRDINPLFVDGMRGFTTTFNSVAPEIYGMERVEVLRGPAGTLYGAGSPGGMVNGVSKRPTPDFFAEIEVGAGSWNQLEGRFDFGGPLDAERKLLYRLTGLAHDGDTQMDYTGSKRTFLAPAFTLRPGPDTTFTLLAQYQKDDGREVQFLPAQGTVLPNPNGTIPTSRFIGEPGYGGYDKEATSFGWILDQRLGGDALLRHSLRYEHRELEFRNVGGLGLQADLRTLSRGVFTVRDSLDSLVTDTNVQMKLGSGAVAHTVLVGVDYKDAKGSDWQAFDMGPDLDVFAPAYGQPIPDPTPYQDQRFKASQLGVYAQDQVRIDGRWLLTLGARHDRAETKTSESFAATDTTDKSSATTWQGALGYLFDSGLAPYVSYAESFEPLAGTSSSGTPFVPTTGTQYEAGVKYRPNGSSSLFSAALFDLAQQNVATTDPDDVAGRSMQIGEIRSRGAELEANAALSRYLSLVAGYSYTDISVTRTNDGNQGKRPSRVPEHLASAWLNYAAPGGFGWGAGVRYVGESFGDFDNTFTVPAFTLLDAALRYEAKEGALKGVRFALNASNLLDKTYVASCEAEGFCIYGQRRTVTASVRVRF
jgi:iron complex outermembrane recepter protein